MKKTDRKRLAGAGLYIALAACVLSAMTINVVSGIKNKDKTGENFELSAVDLKQEGITDKVPDTDKQGEGKGTSTPLVKQEIVTSKTEKLDGIEKPSTDNEKQNVTDTPEKPSEEEKNETTGASQYRSFIKPTSGELGTYKGDTLIYSEVFGDYRIHEGIDIGARLGESVMAFCDGTVTQVYDHALMGKTIVIDHGDGLVSVYKNLSEEVPEGIAAGASVKAGDIIGSVGNSALAKCSAEPHLHFEITYNEESVDPTQYFMTAGK